MLSHRHRCSCWGPPCCLVGVRPYHPAMEPEMPTAHLSLSPCPLSSFSFTPSTHPSLSPRCETEGGDCGPKAHPVLPNTMVSWARLALYWSSPFQPQWSTRALGSWSCWGADEVASRGAGPQGSPLVTLRGCGHCPWHCCQATSAQTWSPCTIPTHSCLQSTDSKRTVFKSKTS